MQLSAVRSVLIVGIHGSDTMSVVTRRQSIFTVAAGLAAAPAVLQGAASSGKIRIAVIGCGGQGMNHVRFLSRRSDVEVRAVCDVDPANSARAVKTLTEAGRAKPRVFGDVRQLLTDDSLNAVLIATPDHWHVPAAILACDAGKHVYLEKPCSHNVREGRALVEAARRNGRLVQHGTQSRSAPYMQRAIGELRNGLIGTVHIARVWNIQRRGSIGHAQPADPPAGVDYETWLGPAPFVPFQSNRFHSQWRWWYAFGTGDFGNDGVHDTDYGVWGLGVDRHPNAVAALGGKYHIRDDQQFPDTQTVICEYRGNADQPSQQLIFEQRLWSTNYPYNTDSGVEFFGTKGSMYLSRRGKVQVLNERNRRVDLPAPEGPPKIEQHHDNFLSAIRGDESLNAPIEVGHRSAALCHLGNIATRLRRTLEFDPETEQILNDDEAAALLTREYSSHWSVPAVG